MIFAVNDSSLTGEIKSITDSCHSEKALPLSSLRGYHEYSWQRVGAQVAIIVPLVVYPASARNTSPGQKAVSLLRHLNACAFPPSTMKTYDLASVRDSNSQGWKA